MLSESQRLSTLNNGETIHHLHHAASFRTITCTHAHMPPKNTSHHRDRLRASNALFKETRTRILPPPTTHTLSLHPSHPSLRLVYLPSFYVLLRKSPHTVLDSSSIIIIMLLLEIASLPLTCTFLPQPTSFGPSHTLCHKVSISPAHCPIRCPTSFEECSPTCTPHHLGLDALHPLFLPSLVHRHTSHTLFQTSVALLLSNQCCGGHVGSRWEGERTDRVALVSESEAPALRRRFTAERAPSPSSRTPSISLTRLVNNLRQWVIYSNISVLNQTRAPAVHIFSLFRAVSRLDWRLLPSGALLSLHFPVLPTIHRFTKCLFPSLRLFPL